MARKQKLLVAIEMNEAIRVIGGERFEEILKNAGIDKAELVIPTSPSETTVYIGGEMMPSDVEAIVKRWLEGDMLHPVNSGSRFVSFVTLQYLETLKSLHFVKTTADTSKAEIEKLHQRRNELITEREEVLLRAAEAEQRADNAERENRNATLIKEETQKNHGELLAEVARVEHIIKLYSDRYGNAKQTKLNWFQKIGAAIFGIC